MPRNQRYRGESPEDFATRQGMYEHQKNQPPVPPMSGGLLDSISASGFADGLRGFPQHPTYEEARRRVHSPDPSLELRPAYRGPDGWMQMPSVRERRGPVYQGPEMSDAMLRDRGMVDAYGTGHVFRPGAGPDSPGHIANREDVNIGGRPVRHPLNRGLF